MHVHAQPRYLFIYTKVVVTSTWKDVPEPYEKLTNALQEYKIPCLGCTSALPFRSNRVHEIRAWLGINGHKYKVEKWIAIDDIDLREFDPHFMDNHFILTTLEQGLTDKKVQECIDRFDKTPLYDK